LDLSKNLFQNWDAISEIVKELRFLRRLSLKYVILLIISRLTGPVNKYSRNCLPAPSSSANLTGAFEKLEELHLNDTLLTWGDMNVIATSMPRLKSVELGYNQLMRLSSHGSSAIKPFSPLQSLNFDSNSLSDWVHICTSLSMHDWYIFSDLTSPPDTYPMESDISLQHLVLTSNVIETIPFPNEQNCSLSSIEYLSLSENRIASWLSLDALSIWIPNLKSLSIRGNPLLNGVWLHHHLQF
jgi:hypothetical protein